MLKTIIGKLEKNQRFFLNFKFLIFKLKRLTQNPKAELKKFWIGIDSGTK